MYVLLKRSRFAWPFFSKFSKVRRYSLHEAEKTIRETNHACLDNHKKLVVEISIHNESDDELLFRDVIELGTGEAYLGNLLALVQHTFREVLDNVSSDDAQRFIVSLQSALVAEAAPVLLTDKESTEAATDEAPGQDQSSSSEPNPSASHDAQEPPDPQPEPSTVRPQPAPTRESMQNRRTAEKKRQPTRQAPDMGALFSKYKRALIVFGAAVLLVVGAVGSYRFFFSPKAAPQPIYQTLVRNEKYLQAGQAYPEKRAAIEAVLVTDGTTSGLAKFQSKYPCANGKFDLAYARKKYQAVISASQKATMSRVRKSKLAVAYLKTKQFEQAEIVNRDLNDQDLQSLIAIGYIQTGQFDQAKRLNAELKNKTIDQAIQTGETYQKAAAHFQAIAKDTSKSAAERAQAKASAASFQHQLETLGE
ncbi:hypothetical protein [Lacticaseibacillus sp. 53-4]|uniref:hypothetical protein n=1 Tax=Lacticaseibacillus sp. 53-4 TaxID=2799575 RepID=UPI0019451A3F|nr:hypothetical protein [Lacticaseibacillus sp. 53-4]